MTDYKLKVASVCDHAFAKLPATQAVTAIMAHHGFDYEPITDPLWFGWPSKLLGFIEMVRMLPEEYTHLMFIDGRDVVLLAGPDQIMEKYFAFGHPWVFAAEPFIWSPGSFEPEDYPTPPRAIYRYLNAGASIGEIGHLRHWFDRWPKLKDLPRGDQDWLAARFIESYPDAIMLDTGCKLFQCMCGSQVGDKPKVTVRPGKVYNRVTRTHPLVIHFNGGTDIAAPDRRGLWEHWL